MTRSVIIRMRRRAPSEPIEQFRMRIHEPEGELLHDRLAKWAESVGVSAGDAWPELPPGVVDRDAELWEPLLAVADEAGGHWPTSARAACIALLKVASDREISLGVRLLGDLRTVFRNKETMSTSDILERLNDMDEAPWGDLYGKKMEPRTLSGILKRYGIKSKAVKIDGRSPRGYRRDQLWDAWERYLAPTPADGQPAQPVQPASQGRVLDTPWHVAPQTNLRATKVSGAQPAPGATVAAVALGREQAQPKPPALNGDVAQVAQVAPVRVTVEDRDAFADIDASLASGVREDRNPTHFGPVGRSRLTEREEQRVREDHTV